MQNANRKLIAIMQSATLQYRLLGQLSVMTKTSFMALTPANSILMQKTFANCLKHATCALYPVCILMGKSQTGGIRTLAKVCMNFKSF